MRKIMNIKYISMIALTAALVGCSKNGQMDEDILPDGPVFSADFQKPSVQSKVTHTDDGNALKLAWVQSDKIGIWTEAEGKSLSPTAHISPIRKVPERRFHISPVLRESAGQGTISRSRSMPAILTMRTEARTRIRQRWGFLHPSPSTQAALQRILLTMTSSGLQWRMSPNLTTR